MGINVQMRWLQCTNLFARAGKAPGLAPLVYWLCDPVDAGIPTNLGISSKGRHTTQYEALTAL